jgi:hypothetical protein
VVVARTKVFCIGFQKTGTTSMEKALRQFGYRVTGVFGDDLPLEDVRRTYVQTALKLAGEYDAVQDLPFPLVFRELDQAFPGSKFILTVRDTDRWFKSISSHFGEGRGPLQALAYGEDAPHPVGHEQRYREVYEAHNRDVLAYFKDRPNDLLVLDLEAGDGWDKLCPFLGEPVPDIPFYHANAAQLRQTMLYRVVARLRKFGVGGKVGTGFWAQ